MCVAYLTSSGLFLTCGSEHLPLRNRLLPILVLFLIKCAPSSPAQALWIIEFELLGMYKDPLWIKYER